MSENEIPLSPRASTRILRMRLVTQEPSRPKASWLGDDSDLDELGACHASTWGAISGLALMVAISVSFWTGVAWIVARVWR